jgi:hypothetical protein
MRKQTAKWKLKDGSYIRICDMTDSHLQNCISFLEKLNGKIEQQLATMPNPFHADIAMQMFDDRQDGLLSGEDELDIDETFPIYNKLLLEKERRNQRELKKETVV